MKRLIVIVALSLSACSSPSTPTPVAQMGSISVTVDSSCRVWITSLNVTIDGVARGSVTPSGQALITPLPLGSHTVQGTSVPFVAGGHASWSSSTRVLTASKPDFTESFYCF